MQRFNELVNAAEEMAQDFSERAKIRAIAAKVELLDLPETKAIQSFKSRCDEQDICYPEGF